MDKELDSIADDIIKDSFGSAAPSAAPTNGELDNSNSASRPQPAENMATPRDTFTAEVPKSQPGPQLQSQPRPVSHTPNPAKSNEYARIKEQMTAARENSNIPSPATFNQITPEKERGLNKIALLFIILIPVIVVAVGIVVALLLQSSNKNSQSDTSSQIQYTDPRDTATKIDLSTYTSDIQITEPGHYILSGSTTFPIKVNASDKVTLYLHDISVTATNASALSNFSHNPLLIFLDDGTESTLAVSDPSTFDSIYSEGDLTIDGGTGILNVSGIKIADGYHYDVTGNGIKDSKGVSEASPNTENTTEDSVAQPAEGESNFQEGSEPPAEPSGSVPEAPADNGPATN